jgi:hypothetical protein
MNPPEILPPILKPKQVKKKPVAIRVFKDGREVCNLNIKEGRDTYMQRIRDMRDRQGKVCCLYGVIQECPGFLALKDATFEHQDGKGHGGGHRDDRIMRPDKKGVLRPYNGAAHYKCNALKASRRLPYNELIDAP